MNGWTIRPCMTSGSAMNLWMMNCSTAVTKSLAGVFLVVFLMRGVAAQQPAPSEVPAPSKVLAPANGAVSAVADREREAWFESRIRPVLVDVCHRCHGGATTSGGLRMDSRSHLLRGGDSGPALVPGEPDRSVLLKAIDRQPDVSAMPPDKERALRPEQVADFKRWIADGAYWPAGAPRLVSEDKTAKAGTTRALGTYAPLKQRELPDVAARTWSQTAVDRFILQRMELAGATPAPPADRRTLLRRATFDLTGLPPTPEELQAFMADDRPDAFERVVERLLQAPTYGERWGRHWLDVVRYADTAGETADYPAPLAWKYRNYVIESWNRDKPYDEFLREQIAGDVLADASTAPSSSTVIGSDARANAVIATGFLAISRRFGFDSENYHHLTIQDSIDTLGQAVLGLSLGCARCHDHKFDAVSMNDYYALYSIFASTRYPFPGSEQKQKVRSLAPLVPPAEAAAAWRQHTAEIARLAHRLQQHGRGLPPGLLRPLGDLDGDFELQAPAAGGSNGVLVPPWLYSGAISITAAAQSPFRNVYATGKSGVSVPANSQPARFEQSLALASTYTGAKQLFVNLDYRIQSQAVAATPRPGHRLSFVDRAGRTIVAVWIEADRLRLVPASPERPANSPTTDAVDSAFTIAGPGEWRNIQLTIDGVSRRVTGVVGTSQAKLELASVTLPPDVDHRVLLGMLERVVFEAVPTANASFPSIEYDQFAIRAEPFAPPSTQFVELEPAALASASTGAPPPASPRRSASELAARLREAAGHDGDLEMQTKDQLPASPWNPGPNSAVRLSAAAQSPFRDFFGPGELGLRMPNRAAYDGFGLTLGPTRTDAAGRLHLAFDFRCVDQAAGGDGTWRYYIGHGAGTSAAIELFFHGSEFFYRTGQKIESAGPVTLGEWHQVRLVLDTQQRQYAGELRGPKDTRKFAGQVAPGWDGGIDYTFIDSYGHRPGVRPSLDADNFLVSDRFPNSAPTVDVATRRQRIAELRRELAQGDRAIEDDERRLRELMREGPFPWAYAMAEGTPHAEPIQRRGEPSLPGELAPREVPAAIGFDAATPIVAGSGRRELAERLARPDHPLTARVIANRVWQYHFGQGLVKTPNDFGARGAPPTHPELLDFLAYRLIRAQWSLKALHREILLSATYQQASRDGLIPQAGSSSASAASPSTSRMESTAAPAAPVLSWEDLYAGFPRRRLGAEEIRDSILAVTGELDRVPGVGHPFPEPPSWGFSQHAPFQAVYDHSKRSVYLMTQRLKRHPFLALFDGPDPNATTPARPATIVPTQSLFFLNDPFLHAAAERWADRIGHSGASRATSVEQVWHDALARMPAAEDRDEAVAFLDDYVREARRESAIPPERLERAALAAYIRIILSSNEFLHVD